MCGIIVGVNLYIKKFFLGGEVNSNSDVVGHDSISVVLAVPLEINQAVLASSLDGVMGMVTIAICHV